MSKAKDDTEGRLTMCHHPPTDSWGYDGATICQPSGVYLGQLRWRGHQQWRTVTGRCRSPEAALARVLIKMGQFDHRARAIWIGVGEGRWYEPYVAMEANR